jgi:hypothetical protein
MILPKQYTNGFTVALRAWGMKKQEFFALTGSVPSAKAWNNAENPNVGVSQTMANKMKDVFGNVASAKNKSDLLVFMDCQQSTSPIIKK